MPTWTRVAVGLAKTASKQGAQEADGGVGRRRGRLPHCGRTVPVATPCSGGFSRTDFQSQPILLASLSDIACRTQSSLVDECRHKDARRDQGCAKYVAERRLLSKKEESHGDGERDAELINGRDARGFAQFQCLVVEEPG